MHGMACYQAERPRMPADDHPRLLRVITRLNIGGPARHALLLTRALSDQFPTTLAAGRPGPEEGELTDPEVPVRRVPLTRPVRPLADAASMLALRRIITSLRPAIVHTHMAKAGAVGRLAALTTGPRPITVHTFHGHVLDGYFSKSVTAAFASTERWLARRTDMLVAVSPEVRDELLDLGIGTPQKFRVVPLGLDLGFYAAATAKMGARFRLELGISESAPLVGIVGRLVDIKDVGCALEVVRELPGVHLAVVGDGERRKALEQKAREASIAERVHFTGWREDVASVMAALDVALLTSRNEGTPVSLIEAQAAGRPVVATDVGGVRQVVADGETGLLAPPGDVETLRRHLRRLLDDRDLRALMGEKGRRRALERFGKERLVAEMAELYRELCQAVSNRVDR
jgi:glycosyltransferase involved in cell wall biosynthesis